LDLLGLFVLGLRAWRVVVLVLVGVEEAVVPPEAVAGEE
jgi:hypothetical protein